VNQLPGYNAGSVNLQHAGESYTDAVRVGATRPHSLLQGLYPNTEGVGMDEATAAARLPDGQVLGNPGGLGADPQSYTQSTMLKLTGGTGEQV
jgi:hypothetical protein